MKRRERKHMGAPRYNCFVGLIAAVVSCCPLVASAQTAAPPPLPEHTGLATLARDTLNDFKAFPQRKSTWVILGVGGALAALAHPVDSDVNRHLVGRGWAEKAWKPGHVIGGPVMVAAPLAIYLGGRYLLPPANDEA